MNTRQFAPPIVIMLSLAVVAPATMATHNSYGAQVNIIFPDELGANGEIIPDLSPSLAPTYHNNLPVPRLSPPDQSGERYRSGCDPNAGAANPCYIGFLDIQWEYYIVASPFLVRVGNDYFQQTVAGNPIRVSFSVINPEPGSPCASMNIVERAQDQDCQGAGHERYFTGNVLIDMDTLDTPFDPIGATLGSERGSSYNTFPLLTVPYAYLFGRAAAGNPAPSPFKAGTGPFSEVPADACKGRTSDGPDADAGPDCYLLTPFDLRARDDHLNPLAAQDPKARFCHYLPQFVTINPDERGAALCGPRGRVMDQFLEVTGAGNTMGTDINGWINTKPGWYAGVLLIGLSAVGFGDGQGAGFAEFAAVNPLVPEKESVLNCIIPNMLTSGDGVHGTYIAHAMDSDLYRSPFAPVEQEAFDTSDAPADLVVDTVNTVIETVQDTLDSLPPLPPEVQAALDAAQVLADEGVDRAFPTEAADAEPDQPGDAWGADAHDFAVDRAAVALACTAAGALVESDAKQLPGILRYNAAITRQTVALRDPTLFEDGLPAPESRTTRGTWQTDVYSFNGVIQGVYDSSEGDGNPTTTADDDGNIFDGCVVANGQAQPANDECPWRALWDVYNPAAVDIGGNQIAVKAGLNHYDTARGVGLYFVLKSTGPLALLNAAPSDPTAAGPGGTRTQMVGEGNPLGTNCVVGTSFGFATKLQTLLGSTSDADLVDDLCGAVSGEKGLLVADAFGDAGELAGGTFAAGVQWAKLVPTPSGVQGVTGGAGDSLCVSAVFSVAAGFTASDTAGNVNLVGAAGTGTTHTFTDCDRFMSVVRP